EAEDDPDREAEPRDRRFPSGDDLAPVGGGRVGSRRGLSPPRDTGEGSTPSPSPRTAGRSPRTLLPGSREVAPSWVSGPAPPALPARSRGHHWTVARPAQPVGRTRRWRAPSPQGSTPRCRTRYLSWARASPAHGLRKPVSILPAGQAPGGFLCSPLLNMQPAVCVQSSSGSS